MIRLDDSGRVIGFVEKPQTPEQLEPLRTPTGMDARAADISGKAGITWPAWAFTSFSRDVLFQLLNAPPLATDFGKEIFPRSIQTHQVQAHLFDGYWEDVGTVKAYHEANLALTSDNPPFDFHSEAGVIYTRMRYLPASRISGRHPRPLPGQRRLRRSARREYLSLGHRHAHPDRPQRHAAQHRPDRRRPLRDRSRAGRQPTARHAQLDIGDDTVIENAILDKDCRVGNNVRIVNQRQVQNEEGKNYVIRDGIVVIPKGGRWCWTGR